jgi:hypothetical protein
LHVDVVHAGAVIKWSVSGCTSRHCPYSNSANVAVVDLLSIAFACGAPLPFGNFLKGLKKLFVLLQKVIGHPFDHFACGTGDLHAVLRIWEVYPGSWILIFTHPGSWIWISDPVSKNSNKREGRKNNCYHTFFCSHKFQKIKSYFIFEMPKKKIWDNFQRIIEVFTLKTFTKLSKI